MVGTEVQCIRVPAYDITMNTIYNTENQKQEDVSASVRVSASTP